MGNKSVRTLGFTLHDDLLGDKPYVYLSYTYRPGANPSQRIVRYAFSVTGANGTLAEPLVLLDSLPASNDHNSGRMVFGPDQKLYHTIGDQGGNQGRNYCKQVLSQVLPSQEEINQRDWRHYPGKTLRINTDGSIPDDNPEIAGVRSHVFSYGHRKGSWASAGDRKGSPLLASQAQNHIMWPTAVRGESFSTLGQKKRRTTYPAHEKVNGAGGPPLWRYPLEWINNYMPPSLSEPAFSMSARVANAGAVSERLRVWSARVARIPDTFVPSMLLAMSSVLRLFRLLTISSVPSMVWSSVIQPSMLETAAPAGKAVMSPPTEVTASTVLSIIDGVAGASGTSTTSSVVTSVVSSVVAALSPQEKSRTVARKRKERNFIVELVCTLKLGNRESVQSKC
jgi:hypothetical protein